MAVYLKWRAPSGLLFKAPNADVTDGGWTDQADGAALAAALDETTPDDSDYIKSLQPPTTGDYFEVSFPSAAGAQQPFSVYYRLQKTGVTDGGVTVQLRQGSTLIAEWTHARVQSEAETFKQTLTSAQFAAISDFTNLRLRGYAVENDDPQSIFGSSLWMWMDAESGVYADDGATLATTYGQKVARWNDRLNPALNQYNRTNTPYQPSYDPYGLNGKPAVEFSQHNKFLKPDGTSLFNSTSITMYFVGRMLDRDNLAGWIFSFGVNESDSFKLITGVSNYPDQGSGIYLNHPSSSEITGIEGAPFIYSFTADGVSKVNSYLDGSRKNQAEFTYTPGSQYPATFGSTARLPRLGYTEAQVDHFSGQMGEIIIAKGAATDDQRTRMRTYFQNKWGLPRNPKAIFGSDLVGWWDACYGPDPNGSGALCSNLESVHTWWPADSFGSGSYITQATSGNRPIWKSRAFNGKYPGVVFADSNDYMANTNFDGLAGATSVACFVVGQVNNGAAANCRWISFANADATYDYNNNNSFTLWSPIASSAYFTIQGAMNDKFGATIPVPATGAPGIFGAEFSTNLITPYVNGVAGTSETGTVTPSFGSGGKLRLGADGFVNPGFVGVMSEVIIIKRIPTSDERDELHRWLRLKWGLSDPHNIFGSDLAGWWDARSQQSRFSDAGSTFALNNGTAVQQWNDRRSNGINLSESTNKPVVADGAFGPSIGGNIWQGVSFDGVNDVLARSNIDLTGSELSLYAVLRISAGGESEAYGRVASLYESSQDYSDAGGFALSIDSNNNELYGQNRSSNVSNELTYRSDNQFVLGMDIASNGNITLRSHTRTATPSTATGGTPAFDATNTFRLGQNNDGSNNLKMMLGEVVLLKKIPTDWQRRQLTQYLENRWACYSRPDYIFGTDLVGWFSAGTNTFEGAGSDDAESADPVQQWNDLSGYGNHLIQATSANRPIYNTAAGVVAKPGIVFTAASSHWMETAANLDIAGSGMTVMVVVQMNSATASSGRIFGIRNTSNDYDSLNSLALLRNVTSDGFAAWINSISQTINSSAYIGSPRIVACTASAAMGNILHLIVDSLRSGGGVIGGTPAFLDNSILKVGGGPGSEYLDGVIHEMVFIKRAITYDEEERLRSYLRAKWDF